VDPQAAQPILRVRGLEVAQEPIQSILLAITPLQDQVRRFHAQQDTVAHLGLLPQLHVLQEPILQQLPPPPVILAHLEHILQLQRLHHPYLVYRALQARIPWAGLRAV